MPTRSTVCGCVFSGIVVELLASGPSVGAWLTGRTVTVKVCEKVFTPPLAVPPLSVTVTVIVAVPLMSAAGSKVSEPVVLGLV